MSEPAAKQRQMINLDEFERRLGRPAAPAKNGEDPLAELARLVGNTEDRFNGLFPPRPTAAPNRAEPRFDVNDRQGPPLPGQKLGGDFSAIEAALRGSITPDFRAAPEQKRLVPEPKYPVAQPKYPAPQPQEEPVFEAQEHALEDEDWLDSPYDSTFVPGPDFAAGPEPEYVVEPARSRLPLYATAAVIVLGLVGIGASFTLKHHTAAPHEIAMIKAAPGPTKIQASDASDTSKPNQDVSLLDKTPQPAPTTVVNHTEEPVDLSSPQAAPQASPAQVEGGAAVVPVPPPPAVEAASAQSFGVSGMIEPRKVKTVAVRPDGTIVSGDAPPVQQNNAPPQNAAGLAPVMPIAAPAEPAAPASPPSTDTAAASPAAPTAVDPTPTASNQDNGQGSGEASNQVSEPKPTKVADARPEASEVASSRGFDVQLAAPATEAEARQALSKLQEQYRGELSGHRLKYHRASVGNKSVWRVRVVGLSHEGATALCQKVQAKGGSCFVARD